MLHDDPNSLDVSYLRRQLESIATSDSSFHKVHAEISELHSPETNDEDEMDILDAHDDSVAKTISLIERHYCNSKNVCFSNRPTSPG